MEYSTGAPTTTTIEEKNPLKQGLKLTSSAAVASSAFIEEKNPLKQGLKQSYTIGQWSIIAYWREESIKTRIET